MKSNVVKKKKWNKVFTVSTEGPCNCVCLGCGTPRIYKPRSMGEIIKDLNMGVKAGYNTVEIIGGEPTIHPDFFYLFKKAKEIYKQVLLTSNGITLADKIFAQEVISVVDNVNITLYGHNALLHEAWTRRRGSFRKTVEGIKNCLGLNPAIVLITHLVWKKNFPFLRELVEFDLKLGVKRVDLLNIQPGGRAKRIFAKVAVPLKDLNNFDLSFIDLLDNFQSVEIEDYPYCIFSKKIWEEPKKNVHIVDIAGQIYLNDKGQINVYDLFVVHDTGFGIDSTLKTQGNIKSINNKLKDYRQYLNACEGCQFMGKCNGIFNEYIKIFGREEVEKEISYIRSASLKDDKNIPH